KVDAPKVMAAIAADGAKVVVLPCDVDSVGALAKAGAGAGLLMLLPCDPDPKVVGATPMLWPTAMAGNEQVAQLVQYARSQNARTAYIVAAKAPTYGPDLARYFRAAAALDGVKIVGESSVDPGTKDVTALAKAIAHAHPDAVFTTLFSPYAEPVIAGLRSH